MKATLLAAIIALCIFLAGCSGITVNENIKASTSSIASPTATTEAPKEKIAETAEVLYPSLENYVKDFDIALFPDTYQSKYAVIRATEGCLTPYLMEKAGKEIDETIEKLLSYLDTDFLTEWNKDDYITYFIKPGELPRAVGRYRKPVVILSPDNGRLPLYAHETTHLLAGCRYPNSTWMLEGLAVYLNSKFSAYPTWPQYDRNIDKLAKERYENGFDHVINFEEETDYILHDPLTSDGEAYYLLAASFVKYVEEQVGIKAFMAAYKTYSADLGLRNETGKTIKEWKEEWISYLEAMDD